MLHTQGLTGAACQVMSLGHNGLKKSKEEAHNLDLGATGELKVQAWYRWTVGSQQLPEDRGWRLGKCEYCSPDLVLILTKP